MASPPEIGGTVRVGKPSSTALARHIGRRLIPHDDAVEIHFPKRKSRREAKQEVAAKLDEIDPEWNRILALYPPESALRDRGE